MKKREYQKKRDLFFSFDWHFAVEKAREKRGVVQVGFDFGEERGGKPGLKSKEFLSFLFVEN